MWNRKKRIEYIFFQFMGHIHDIIVNQWANKYITF